MGTRSGQINHLNYEVLVSVPILKTILSRRTRAAGSELTRKSMNPKERKSYNTLNSFISFSYLGRRTMRAFLLDEPSPL